MKVNLTKILTIIFLFVIIAGIGITVYLVMRPESQDIRKEAAIEECNTKEDCEEGQVCVSTNCVDGLTTFITSESYSGNLLQEATDLELNPTSGLDAADKICNYHASQEGLTGTYVAWLSNSSTDAKNRVSDTPYYLVKSSTGLEVYKISDSLSDLTNGDISNSIWRKENGIDYPVGTATSPDEYGNVWTGTKQDGTKNGTIAEAHCSNWTDNTASFQGNTGSMFSIDSSWTQSSQISCDLELPIYCFEVSSDQPDQDLVLHLKLDEGSGTTATDSSSYGNNGTITGGEWVEGKRDGALQFDGDDSITIPDNDSLLPESNDFTIAMWIKTTASGNAAGSEDNFLFLKKQDEDNELTIFITQYPPPNVEEGVVLIKMVVDGTEQLLYSSQSLNDDAWHHIAIAKNTDTVVYYIDGLEHDSVSNDITSISPTGDLILGQEYSGQLDEIKYLMRALTAQEVCQEFGGTWNNNTCSPMCTSPDDCTDPTPYCDVETGLCVECTENDHCSEGEVCSGQTCVPETEACTDDEQCKPECVGEKRHPYFCDPATQQCKIKTAILACDTECGADCGHNNDCENDGVCNVDTCTCQTDIPYDSCKRADLTGKDGIKDNQITIYDVAFVVNNFGWKQGKTAASEPADVASNPTETETGGPDGEVNIFDVTKIVNCWKAEI